jgi:predicted transcriptional regulator of viral defense system
MYKLNELIKLDRKLYHSNDLAILWGITNRNTLYTTIKRYVQKGILLPVFKGLYSTVPIAQLDPRILGQAIIHKKAYLTTESVLVSKGIIAQMPYMYTFVSSISRKVTVGDMTFLYRQLHDIYLNNPIGVEAQEGFYTATVQRAVADMLYFNPKYHFDLHTSIDWKMVKAIQKEVGYK